MTINRLSAAGAAAVLTAAALAFPASATAAENSAVTSIPSPQGTIEMHVNANCVRAQNRCFFTTSANLLTPDGPTGFPGDTWARQTVTLRSTSRDVWQQASYSAPAGMPRELKGANHDNVLSKMYRSLSNVELSVTYFGGGPIERFTTDGESEPIDWATGKTATAPDFIACSVIQVVFGGVNLTTPTACAQTTFS